MQNTIHPAEVKKKKNKVEGKTCKLKIVVFFFFFSNCMCALQNTNLLCECVWQREIERDTKKRDRDSGCLL